MFECLFKVIFYFIFSSFLLLNFFVWSFSKNKIHLFGTNLRISNKVYLFVNDSVEYCVRNNTKNKYKISLIIHKNCYSARYYIEKTRNPNLFAPDYFVCRFFLKKADKFCKSHEKLNIIKTLFGFVRTKSPWMNLYILMMKRHDKVFKQTNIEVKMYIIVEDGYKAESLHMMTTI